MTVLVQVPGSGMYFWEVAICGHVASSLLGWYIFLSENGKERESTGEKRLTKPQGFWAGK